MAIREVEFQSYNGRDTVKGWIYIPIRKPRAVVQIVHGLGEHSRRYLHMILKMIDAGFVVCADDHVGHGKTAHDAGTWGDLGDKGYLTTIEDEHSLREICAADYPDLPYVMYGHSWGSIIARNYAAKYSGGLSGLVLCGAPADNANILSLVNKAEPYIRQGKGSEVVEALAGSVFSTMVDRYENPKTPNDWIAVDEDVVADHGSDPFNNLHAPMNVQLLYDLGVALQMAQGTEWAAKLPAGLPVYNIAGDMDPAAGFGEGTYKISNWLAQTGHKRLETKVYSGYRHEIHNEPPIRDEVEDGIIRFVEGCLA